MSQPTGMEPVLGGSAGEVTGMEPELGGPFRLPVDPRLWAELLSRNIRRIRRAAAEVGASGKSRQYTNALVTVVTKEEGGRRFPARDRRSALEALCLLGGPVALETILTALADEDWRIRQYAAWALGELDDYRTVDALSKALKDESDYVRLVAADALQRMNSSRARKVLQQFWDSRAG